MRLLVIHHPYDRPRFEQDFVDRLSERPEITVAAADLAALAGGRLAGDGAFAGFDAVAVFVAFNRLRSAPALDWQGFSGRRVLIDHDAIQNYSDIAGDTYAGAWPPAFRRHGPAINRAPFELGANCFFQQLHLRRDLDQVG